MCAQDVSVPSFLTPSFPVLELPFLVRVLCVCGPCVWVRECVCVCVRVCGRAQTPLSDRGLWVARDFRRVLRSVFSCRCPPDASAPPWRRRPVFPSKTFSTNSPTPFCVRNTSQTRIFEICLRTPRRFAHEHVHERALASARRRSYESACRGKDTGRRRAALVERRCLLCTVGRRRWLLCTVSRQRWGAACSAHAIDGPRAGTGTMHR